MQNSALLSKLVSGLPLGICIVDKDYNILFWNDFFTDRLGIPPQNDGTINLLELFPQEARFLKKKINSVFIIKFSQSYFDSIAIIQAFDIFLNVDNFLLFHF
jgi:PAS domain-containing protein